MGLPRQRRNGPLEVATGRFTWDVPSTTAQTASTTTVNLAGVKAGDSVVVTPDAPNASFVYGGYVSAASTVTLRAVNFTGGTVDPASTIFTVLAQRPL